MPNVITSTHVTLRELTTEQASALLVDGAKDDDWAPGYPFSGTLSAADSFSRRTGDQIRPGFGLYQIVRNDDGLVVGDIGFHSVPADGAVEVGFGVIGPARGMGIAKESLAALAEWALAQDGVERITARTAKKNLPSRAVLEGCGFRATAEDGDLITFTRSDLLRP